MKSYIEALVFLKAIILVRLSGVQTWIQWTSRLIKQSNGLFCWAYKQNSGVER